MQPITPHQHAEHFLHAAGVHKSILKDISRVRISHLVKARLTWLLVGLGGGMLATVIVERFEYALKQELALAFFIPVIVYMADAVGTQTETLFLRTELLGHIGIKRYVFREGVTGFALGLILGGLGFGASLLMFHEFKLAVIVGVSLFTAIFLSVFVAVAIPMLFMKFGKDPGFGGGPFATIIQDLLSIVIYFAVATALL